MPEGAGNFCTERTFGHYFFFYCFQVAVGVCPRGVLGRRGCLGAQQRPPRLLVRALTLSPRFQEFSLHLQTAEVSLSGAWGRGEPTGDLGARPGASESCVIVGSVPDRPSADGGQGRLGSEMSTLSALRWPRRTPF